MKIGDLVKPLPGPENAQYIEPVAPTVGEEWVGLVIGFEKCPMTLVTCPVVYWNEEYSSELELEEQISVIESR